MKIEEVIDWVLKVILFSIPSAIATAIVKKWIDAKDERIKKVKKDLGSLRRELSNLKENLPKEYVLKDDHEKDISELKQDIKEVKDEIKDLRKEIKDGFRRLEERILEVLR